jgi:hypothetical protein
MNLPLARAAAAAALALAAAGSALAQGTITSGTTTLSFVGTPFGTGTGNANLLFGGSFATDQLFRIGWSYNQGVGTSNRPFSALDTPVASYVGNVATFTWTNAGAGTAGFARFNATLTVTLSELAPGPGGGVPGSARVDSVLSFTAAAANAAPVAYALFQDLDFDIQGTTAVGGDTYRVLDASGVSGRAFDTSSAQYVEFAGVGANRYEFNTGSALRTRVGAGGTGTGNLSTLAGVAVADWASTDGAVAFQWNRTLAPGETALVQSAFTINAPIPEPASALLMLAGVAAMGGAALRRQPR